MDETMSDWRAGHDPLCIARRSIPAHRCHECDRLRQAEARGRVATCNDMVDDLMDALAAARREIKPPYMFPDVVGLVFPLMQQTTIGEAIEDVWNCAFDEAQYRVIAYLRGRARGPIDE